MIDGELVSALDGDWPTLAADTADKIRTSARTRGAEISEGAVQQATRATQILKTGTPAWLRAEDLKRLARRKDD